MVYSFFKICSLLKFLKQDEMYGYMYKLFNKCYFKNSENFIVSILSPNNDPPSVALIVLTQLGV